MSTHENVAQVEFEQASNTAGDLAERIAQCRRNGGSGAQMVVLLKAWQAARAQARVSHERLLERHRGSVHSFKRYATA